MRKKKKQQKWTNQSAATEKKHRADDDNNNSRAFSCFICGLLTEQKDKKDCKRWMACVSDGANKQTMLTATTKKEKKVKTIIN